MKGRRKREFTVSETDRGTIKRGSQYAGKKTDRSRAAAVLRQLVPWAAALLILLAGYESVNLIRRILPDYKNEVVSYGTPEKNSPIYLQSDDALAVYPWDTYDEQKAVSLPDFVAWFLREELEGQEWDGESENSSEWEAQIEQQIQEQIADSTEYMEVACAEVFSGMADLLVPWYGIDSFDSVYQAVTYHDGVFYLKDFQAVGFEEDGTSVDYEVNLAIDTQYGGFYYHYRRAERGELSVKEIDEAHNKLQKALDETREYQALWYEMSYVGDGLKAIYPEDMEARRILEENPIVSVWYRLKWGNNPGFEDSDLMSYYAMLIMDIVCGGQDGADSCDILVYQGELLMIFSSKNGNQLIFYYDPRIEKINGISLDPGALK